MALLGTILTLLTGPTIPVPAPATLMDCLDQAEVTTSDQGRSGFQLILSAGRAGRADASDYPLLSGSLLLPFSRVVLLVNFGGLVRVLMDGVVTHRELIPGSGPGTGTLTVTGEDISVLMDLEEKSVEHPAQDETAIATTLIGQYAAYGMVPRVIAPPAADRPTVVERVPVQQATDLGYLNQMARRYGYVCYVTAGPAPKVNTAYWGPPVRDDPPQRTLSVDVGPDTNVQQISFRSNALAPAVVTGQVQDRATNKAISVHSSGSSRAPLAAQPDWQVNPKIRTALFRDSGLTGSQARAWAQGAFDASTDSVTATGTLDALRYGDLLTARGLVGLRGAGFSHDGLYYVRSVTHRIRPGEYTQSFTLTRDGLGSTVTAVQP